MKPRTLCGLPAERALRLPRNRVQGLHHGLGPLLRRFAHWYNRITGGQMRRSWRSAPIGTERGRQSGRKRSCLALCHRARWGVDGSLREEQIELSLQNLLETLPVASRRLRVSLKTGMRKEHEKDAPGWPWIEMVMG